MEWTEEIDELGIWKTNGHVRVPIKLSAEFEAKRQEQAKAEETDPTQEEYMMDLDYRLSVIELGL